jgi:hypothetical protein
MPLRDLIDRLLYEIARLARDRGVVFSILSVSSTGDASECEKVN